MTDFLVKRFIKNYTDTENNAVRGSYGTLASVTGIVCNIILFLLKFAVGTLSGSISVMSDAFNNLSDCASCVVTLIGCKMAAKPADKDHPFGHGRMEYLTSLIIAAVIMMVGFELLKSSALKITSPSEVTFSIAALISLIASIGIKLWMSFFNGRLGKMINSPVMAAAAQDSRNDVIATAAAAAGLTASAFTSFPLDGIMGAVVSVFVIRAGFGIIKDTVDDLLGKPADPELTERIKKIVTAPDKIIGVHDLVVHDYGPGKKLASCHAEVRSDENFLAAHDIIDGIEREIYSSLGIIMTIHMDPVDMDNEQTKACREQVQSLAQSIDSGLKIHDFRLISGDTHINLVFDVVIPYGCGCSEQEIRETLTKGINKDAAAPYFLVITFDRDFSGS